MKNKLYIIGSAGIPARYGGFETFAHQLSLNIVEKFDVYIACSQVFYPPNERHEIYNSINRFFIPNNANGISGLIYDLRALLFAQKHSGFNDLILILGCGPGILLPFLPLLRKRKLLIHLDGLEWERAKWNFIAKAILRISWSLSLRYCSKAIIDNQELFNYIPKSYKSKTILCTYGSDHLPNEDLPDLPFDYSFALVIARAEPENKLDIILETFNENTGMKLILISNYHKTSYGCNLNKKYSKNTNIEFIEAIYNNPSLLQAYRKKCKLYIHGHSVGGTNPSLIEAMANGVPIIAWDNKFNRNTTDNSALYFNNKVSLLENLRKFDKPFYVESGRKLQTIARRKYIWKNVARDFLNSIEE